MTATFGKLQTETLRFRPGLNVLQMPNETGKTTWCAFLLAMLYGVDTSERETRTNFPAKKHYAPWTGNAMEGRIQLVHEGRRITIERASTARTPLGIFRAFDTESGLPIDTLTAQNCGQVLLGVPRQVFERSAFLRQDGMTIQMDATLEQRLEALVTTGDEAISYQQIEQILRERRNRCRHNKTGLIPQTEAALEGVSERLTRLDTLHEALAQARVEEQQLRSQLQIQKMQLSALQARQVEAHRTQLTQAGAEATEKIAQAKALEEICRTLPPLATAQAQERELNRLESARHTLALDIASLPQPEAAPAVPQPFAGLDEAGIHQKGNVDVSQLRLAQAVRKPRILWWLPFMVALVAAGALWLQGYEAFAIIAAALTVILALAGAIGFFGKRRAWKRAQHTLRQLQDSYGVTSPDDLEALTARCREEFCRWQEAQALHNQERRALEDEKARLEAECDAFLASLAFHSATMAEAAAQLRETIEQHLAWESAHRSAEQAYRHYNSLKQALGTMPKPTATDIPVPAGKTVSSLQAEILSAERKLQQIRSTLDRGEGQCSTLGDRMELGARQQQLQARLEALEEEYDALCLALTAVGKANENLQNRFSPQLTALAAKYLGDLTNGAYSRLMLDRQLGASLYPRQAPASREAAYFSGGTRDQLYLAVRLAVSQLLTPAAPLILDDALVRFDDDRLLAALQVLKKEAKTRQVLLFTCQSREADAFQKL